MTNDKAGFEVRAERIGDKARAQQSHTISRVISQPLSETARISFLRELLPFSEAEIRNHDHQSKQKILSRLRAALRRERVQGRAGHWTYDLNRHIALSQALHMEIQHQS